MFKVYQVHLNDAEYNAVNRGEEVPKFVFKRYNEDFKVWKDEEYGYYDHVANVATDDLNKAFAIMNLWGEENEAKVERLGKVHSLSVGDVLVNENNEGWLVAWNGFDPINGSRFK